MFIEDRTGKPIYLYTGLKFRATDRNGRTFTYLCTGKFYYYELILLNLNEEEGNNETRVTLSWFSERDIEPLETE